VSVKGHTVKAPFRGLGVKEKYTLCLCGEKNNHKDTEGTKKKPLNPLKGTLEQRHSRSVCKRAHCKSPLQGVGGKREIYSVPLWWEKRYSPQRHRDSG